MARRLRGELPLMTAANAAKSSHKSLILLTGAPEEIRTPDPQIRSLLAAVSRSLDAVIERFRRSTSMKTVL